MTETEKKALEQAVAAAGRRMQDYAIMAEENVLRQSIEAHARVIEQHEAYKQEVSDAAVKATHTMAAGKLVEASGILAAFIIPKTNPLVEAMRDACGAQGIATKHTPGELTKHFRAALAARGGRIVWEGE